MVVSEAVLVVVVNLVDWISLTEFKTLSSPWP